MTGRTYRRMLLHYVFWIKSRRTIINVLINWEPAYPSERIFGRSSWLHNVGPPKGCPSVKRFVITASAGDTAVPMPFWGTYLGEDKSYKKFCAADYDGPLLVHCVVADEHGQVELTRPGTRDIHYVDASKLISENAYGTGGGSHCDI